MQFLCTLSDCPQGQETGTCPFFPYFVPQKYTGMKIHPGALFPECSAALLVFFLILILALLVLVLILVFVLVIHLNILLKLVAEDPQQ